MDARLLLHSYSVFIFPPLYMKRKRLKSHFETLPVTEGLPDKRTALIPLLRVEFLLQRSFHDNRHKLTYIATVLRHLFDDA